MQKYLQSYRWTGKSLRGIWRHDTCSQRVIEMAQIYCAETRISRIFSAFSPMVTTEFGRCGWVSWKTIGGYPRLSSSLSSRKCASKIGRGQRWCMPAHIHRPGRRITFIQRRVIDTRCQEKNGSICDRPPTTGHSALVRRNHFASLREAQSRWV